jgi:hypothetical protein
MFCLLPPTRLALGALTEAEVPHASGLFNLMRNLGGAIGIALIDTILYGRTGGHAEALRDRLIAGDITAAQAIGLDLELFTHRPPDVSDATVEAYLRPMVERAAFALSTNEAWALLAFAALLGLLLVPFAGPPPQAGTRTNVESATGRRRCSPSRPQRVRTSHRSSHPRPGHGRNARPQHLHGRVERDAAANRPTRAAWPSCSLPANAGVPQGAIANGSRECDVRQRIRPSAHPLSANHQGIQTRWTAI